MSDPHKTEILGALPVPRQPVDDWTTLKGEDVEIHIGSRMTDRGRVDDVMADGSILWLKHDGASGRRIIQNLSGTFVRLRPSCPRRASLTQEG